MQNQELQDYVEALANILIEKKIISKNELYDELAKRAKQIASLDADSQAS